MKIDLAHQQSKIHGRHIHRLDVELIDLHRSIRLLGIEVCFTHLDILWFHA